MWFKRSRPSGKTTPVVTQTLTVLYSRTGGYTSQGEDDVDAVVRELFAIEQHVAKATADAGGRVLNAFNGAFSAVFASAPAAYRSASAIVDYSGRIPLACGLHAGQVYSRGDRYFGSSLNTANRICSLASNGSIIVSDSVAGLLKPHLGPAKALRTLEPMKGLGAVYQVVEARELAHDSKRAFISYRRQGGAEAARLIAAGLGARGVETFVDVDNLNSSHFDTQLMKRIEGMRNFVPIFSPGALDDADDPNNWMVREVVHAVGSRRHVVPVLMPGFKPPADAALPAAVSEALRYQGITWTHEFANEAIARLFGYLQSEGGAAPTVGS